MRDTIFQSCVEPQQNVSFIGIMTILIINHITHHRNSAQSQTKQEVNSSLKENTLMSSDIFDYGLHELQVDNSCNYVQIKLRCASILKHFISHLVHIKSHHLLTVAIESGTLSLGVNLYQYNTSGIEHGFFIATLY